MISYNPTLKSKIGAEQRQSRRHISKFVGVSQHIIAPQGVHHLSLITCGVSRSITFAAQAAKQGVKPRCWGTAGLDRWEIRKQHIEDGKLIIHVLKLADFKGWVPKSRTVSGSLAKKGKNMKKLCNRRFTQAIHRSRCACRWMGRGIYRAAPKPLVSTSADMNLSAFIGIMRSNFALSALLCLFNFVYMLAH